MLKRLLKVHTGPGERREARAAPGPDVSHKKAPEFGGYHLMVGVVVKGYPLHLSWSLAPSPATLA